MWKASYECNGDAIIVTSAHQKNENIRVIIIRGVDGVTAMLGNFPDGFRKGIITQEYMNELGFICYALTDENEGINHPCILAMLTASRKIIGWLQAGGIIFQLTAA